MMMETSGIEKSVNEIIIEPKKGWQPLDWKEAWRYKDLFYFLVWRDIKIVYKQTVLGFGWAIIRPLLGMVIFSVVFGRLAKLPSDGVPYPVFSYTALVPWTYFSTALSGSTQSLINQASVFTKVYFPRLFIPLTAVFSKLLDFVIAFLILGILFAYFKIVPPWNEMVYLPFLILLMTVTACGMGLWLSAVAVQYRDVKHAVEFASQFLMYAAPVVWPASLIPAKYRLIYGLYPMAGVIEGFRSCLIGAKPMPWDLITSGTISAVLITVSGAYYFKRMEKIFADVA